MALKGIAHSILPQCLFALLLLPVVPATAGIIQIETQTSITVVDSIVEVAVKAANKGDEPARNVRVHIMFSGKSRSRQGKDLLREGESVTVFFRNISSALRAGTYPLITRISFQDIKGHPFSAVSCSSVLIGQSAESTLECLGKGASISIAGLLRFTVRNSGSRSCEAGATLVLPEELSTQIPHRDFVIGPGEKKVLLFEVSNFSALVGAVYPVFCCLEYDSEDAHYTEVGNGSLRIVKAENLFRRTRPVWLGLAIVTGAILAACQFKRKDA
jgi:hypothetical protein